MRLHGRVYKVWDKGTKDLSFTIGTIIDDKYELLQLIGEGGAGAVYKARDTRLGTLVAIKFLHESSICAQKSYQRFLREGRVLAKLVHSSILQVLSVGLLENKIPYLVTEYLSGSSLKEVLYGSGRMPIERTLQITVLVCDAMEFAHRLAVVHRDLTPANIMLLDGEPDRIKVIDFGFSRLTLNQGLTLTETGTVLGSLHFMSPEQFKSARVDSRSDIYSLGCVLHTMLTGAPPFESYNPLSLWQKHATEAPPPLSESIEPHLIPSGLQSILLRAMAKDPEDRYQTMSEFRNDLLLILTDDGSKIKPTPAATRQKPRSDWRIAVCMIAVSVMSIAAGLTGFVQQKQRSASSADNTYKSVLRRLRSRRALKELPYNERVAYCRAWLDEHKGQESTDALQAMLVVACDGNINPGEAEKQLRKTVETGCRLIQKLLRNGAPPEEIYQTVQLIEEAYAAMSDHSCLADQITGVLNLLHRSNSDLLIPSMNCCRTMLVENYIKRKVYAKALPLVNESIDSQDSAFPGYEVLLRWKVLQADCLFALKDNGATEKLTETVELALSAKVVGWYSRTELIKLLIRAGKYDDAIRVLKALEESIRSSGKDKVCLGGALADHAKALRLKHQYQEAFTLLETQYAVFQEHELEFAALQQMAEADVQGNLHKGSIVSSAFASKINQAKMPLQGKFLQLYFNSLDCISPYLKKGTTDEKQVAVKMFKAIYRLSSIWKLDETTALDAMIFADEFAKAGLDEDRTALLLRIWDQCKNNDPGFVLVNSLHQRLASVLIANHQDDIASSIYAALEKSGAKIPQANGTALLDARLLRAQALAQAHRMQEAIELLSYTEKTVQSPQQRTQVKVIHAAYLFAIKDTVAAESLCRQVVNESKTKYPLACSDAWRYLFNIHCQQGNLTAADSDVGEIIRLAPEAGPEQVVKWFDKVLTNQRRTGKSEIVLLLETRRQQLLAVSGRTSKSHISTVREQVH